MPTLRTTLSALCACAGLAWAQPAPPPDPPTVERPLAQLVGAWTGAGGVWITLEDEGALWLLRSWPPGGPAVRLESRPDGVFSGPLPAGRVELAPSADGLRLDGRLSWAPEPSAASWRPLDLVREELTPLYGDGEDNWYAPPLFMTKWNLAEQQRETDVLWPLYSKSEGPGRWSVAVRPFFGVEVDQARAFSEWSVLWPLFEREQLGDQRWTSVRPFFWSHSTPDEGYAHFFPLWWSTWSREHTTFISPLFQAHESEGRWSAHAWPLFGRHDLEAGGTRVFTGGHLFWVDVGDEERGGFAAPAPLIMGRWGPEGHLITSPLFSSWREGEQNWNTTIPFYLWYESAPDSYQLWTIPYSYTHRPETWRHDVLFPFVTAEGTHDDEAFAFAARPLFWYDRNPERTWSLAFPLWYSYQSQDRYQLISLPW